MRTSTIRPDAGRWARTLRLMILCSLLVLAGTGCAWNYAAGTESEEESEQTEPARDDPNVVRIESEPNGGTSATSTQNGGGDAGDEDSSSPCGQRTFEIHSYDESTRTTKRIDCRHRKIVSVNRAPIDEEQLEAAERAGLPKSTWYVLVDPKGQRPEYLTKDRLMQIQREFDLRFLGRDDRRQLLIYEYHGDL